MLWKPFWKNSHDGNDWGGVSGLCCEHCSVSSLLQLGTSLYISLYIYRKIPLKSPSSDWALVFLSLPFSLSLWPEWRFLDFTEVYLEAPKSGHCLSHFLLLYVQLRSRGGSVYIHIDYWNESRDTKYTLSCMKSVKYCLKKKQVYDKLQLTLFSPSFLSCFPSFY